VSAGVRVVLVRPDTAANVGATARAMRNGGLSELVLVAPGDWRTLEAWRTAWGAHEVLEDARVCATVSEALGGCTYTVAFTGRRPGLPVDDVRDAAAEALRHGRAALVFGPESSGLSDAEIATCGRAATIPAHPAQPSLNLSHAVMVAVYELHRAAGPSEPPAPDLAAHDEKNAVLGPLREGLRTIGALPAQEEAMRMEAWAGLLHRLPLLRGEVRMIEHVARRMARRARNAAHAGVRGSQTPSAAGSASPMTLGPGPTQAGVRGSQTPASAGPKTVASSPVQPFMDVKEDADGVDLPELKLRELLFVGALRREGEEVVRDPSRPLPPFRVPDLFPDGARFRIEARAGERVLLRPVRPGPGPR
jgi:tRNA/rRNA methyltransferase